MKILRVIVGFEGICAVFLSSFEGFKVKVLVL